MEHETVQYTLITSGEIYTLFVESSKLSEMASLWWMADGRATPVIAVEHGSCWLGRDWFQQIKISPVYCLSDIKASCSFQSAICVNSSVLQKITKVFYLLASIESLFMLIGAWSYCLIKFCYLNNHVQPSFSLSFLFFPFFISLTSKVMQIRFSLSFCLFLLIFCFIFYEFFKLFFFF